MTAADGSDGPDYEGAYRALRLELTGLLEGQPDGALAQPAPATPEWRVRDVVAHLGGVCDDIAHGNMDGVATDPWTRAQVEKRHDWSFDRVLADWSDNAAVVEPMMNGIGHPIGQMVFDAWTHEQDVRGALGVAGGRDSDAMEISWEWFRASSEAMGEGQPGAILVVTEAGETPFGRGDPVATVRTTRFEFLRAVTGRRSCGQVRALDVDGAELDDLIFFNEFFSPSAHDIIE